MVNINIYYKYNLRLWTWYECDQLIEDLWQIVFNHSSCQVCSLSLMQWDAKTASDDRYNTVNKHKGANLINKEDSIDFITNIKTAYLWLLTQRVYKEFTHTKPLLKCAFLVISATQNFWQKNNYFVFSWNVWFLKLWCITDINITSIKVADWASTTHKM